MTRVIQALLKLVAWALILGIPLASVWLGSSLAAFENRATWLPIVAGALLFPVLPLLWELWSARRRAVKGRKREDGPKPRILTLSDRLLFRTFGLNALALGIILGVMPTRAADAVAVRGDWFLDDASGAWVEPTREAVSWLSERAQVLRELQRADAMTRVAEEGSEDGEDGRSQQERPARDRAGGDGAWPYGEEVHPVVQAMPASVETSLQSVGEYIAANTSGDFDTLRALHAWIGTNIAYDGPAYVRGEYPPQDAETVFRQRVGVCAGYAQLLRAMGEAAGLNVEYVVGVSRDGTGAISGAGHAWNAVELDSGWVLVDVTWDAGTLRGEEFVPQYGTAHLATPPEVFGITHLPNDPRWQLRDRPITRTEFSKLPMMRTAFFVWRLELLEPDRSQTTVDRAPVIRLANPAGVSVSANVEDLESGESERCQVNGAAALEVSCPMSDGQYRVTLYAAEAGASMLWSVGTLEFNVR